MSNTNPIIIETKDCHPFILRYGEEEAIKYFAQNVSHINAFYFTPEKSIDADSKVIEYDSSKGLWCAGRFVGESNFTFNNKLYKISIKPRFGELILFKMLEAIFNVRLTESRSAIKRERDFQFLIKKLISFIWLTMLAKVNIHGLPRKNIGRRFKGSKIRGRINILQSIHPYFTTSEVVSKYREKEIDETIAQILFQAYNILIKDYLLGSLKVPNNAEDAINQLLTKNPHRRNLTIAEYHNIRYRDIYKTYKRIVDFSWDIIQRKNISSNIPTQNNQDSHSFFIDMAEIWELFLRSLLRKYLSIDGWSLRQDKIFTYAGKYYQRELIPDIVFQKGDDLIVWDAKYKRMLFTKDDFDRVDFFQIHTYIQFFQQINKNIICGGLLYPLSAPPRENFNDKAVSPNLFGVGGNKTKFLIDGIDLSAFCVGNENQAKSSVEFKEKELDFINRIKSYLDYD